MSRNLSRPCTIIPPPLTWPLYLRHDDEFGFSAPAVAEFQRRHRVDPRRGKWGQACPAVSGGN